MYGAPPPDYGSAVRFMVVETYLHGPGPVYERVRAGGRRIPEGIVFVDSWVDAELGRCWQLMDAVSEEALQQWTSAWSDLVAFEIVPVVSSEEATRRVLR